MQSVLRFFIHRKPLLLFLFSILLLTIIQQSCKKTDFAQEGQPVDRTKQFFATISKDKGVLRIITLLKKENERTGFVNKLPASAGFPVWGKIVLQKGATAARGGGEDSTENYVIPLTTDNVNLSSVIVAVTVADGYLINCYTATDYLYTATHDPTIDSAKATNALTLFFYMESYTFGNNTFYHIPARFFGNSKILDADSNKTITIKPVLGGGTDSSGLVPIQWICLDYMCPVCNGADPDCPICGYWTECIPIGGGETPPLPPPGNPQNPTPPGGGGGSGGGGGNPPPPPNQCRMPYYVPTPCEPPIPPPHPPVIDTILDPCADATLLQTDESFKSYMQELKDSCNSNREYGFFLHRDPSNNLFGDLPLGLIAGPANKLSLGDFVSNSIIDCIAHCHFNTNTDSTRGGSVFSPDDLWTMCEQFNAGNIGNNSTFTLALITKNGTQYLLKIEILTKFRSWAQKFTQGNMNLYRTAFEMAYGIKSSNTNDLNEKNFLKYLKLNSGSGLKLFRGNNNFTNWQPIGLDINNNVINVPCQ